MLLYPVILAEDPGWMTRGDKILSSEPLTPAEDLGWITWDDKIRSAKPLTPVFFL